MKKHAFIFTGFSLFLLFSCDKKEEVSYSKNLDSYVDSVKTLSVTSNESWGKIETGYQLRLAKAESQANTEEDKKIIEENKQEFQELRSRSENNNNTNLGTGSNENSNNHTSPGRKKEIRDALFGQGKLGKDMKFDWVTSANILSVYERFVSSVKANKDSYSREDWDEVKVLYEALDTRKNKVEKTLSSKDNMQIAKRKVEFASYKFIERPMSKVKENQDAKN